MTEEIIHKTCTKCGESKPLGAFSKHKGRKDGLRDRCRGCIKVLMAADKKANPGKIAARKRAYYAANPKKAREYVREYAKVKPRAVG